MIDPLLPDDAHAPVSTRVLRQFAGICIVFFGSLALWHGWWHHNFFLASVYVGVSVVLGLLGLLVPAAIRPVFAFLMAVTFPIGLVVSYVLLGVMFYGVLTPIGFVFRLLGRDVLDRRFQKDAESYWCTTAQPTDVHSYFRQS